MRPKILILYHQTAFPLRSTVRDLLYCYRNYGDAECIYLNTAGRSSIPASYFDIPYDLIIFHTTFISLRWGGDKAYDQVKNLLAPLIQHAAYKIVLPQDEWIHTTILNRLIIDFHIQAVYTVAPESEWKKIYHDVDFNKVAFHYVLTGYIDSKVVSHVNEKPVLKRTIDIGYRAFKAPPWLGLHGFLKTDIADVFNRTAPAEGFITDISTNEKDTILGDAWYDFLLNCRYFIGLEGGSTVIDPTGSIWEMGQKFLQANPNASFNEVEHAVFPGMDGNLKLIAISPRHLECCITKTCQVLMEGDYNGILKPGIHYIELKKDYSNLKEVFRLMKDDSLRERIAECAYQDIVASGEYHYEAFVRFVLSTSIHYSPDHPANFESSTSLEFGRMETQHNEKLARRSALMKSALPLRKLYRYSGLKYLVQLIKK